MKQTSSAWAIKRIKIGRLGLYPCFISRYYFNNLLPLPHQAGIRTALFKTRHQAREAKKHLYNKQDFRVVKVDVTIQEAL